MNIKFPTNDLATISLLESVALEAINQETGTGPIKAELQTQINDQATAFRTERDSLQTARNQLKDARDNLRAAERKLTRLIRLAYQAVRNRAAEPDFPRAHVTFFGLLQNATNPRTLERIKNPIQKARDILHANTELTADGITVLVDPSQEQIQAQHDEVQLLEVAFSDALAVERAAFQVIKNRRKQAVRLLRRIRFELTFAFEELGEVERRQAMRAYGFRFQSQTRTEAEDSDATSTDAPDGSADDSSTNDEGDSGDAPAVSQAA